MIIFSCLGTVMFMIVLNSYEYISGATNIIINNFNIN